MRWKFWPTGISISSRGIHKRYRTSMGGARKTSPFQADEAMATAAQAKTLTSQNDQEENSYAIYKGARQGCGKNIRQCLPADHVCEFEEKLYRWKRVTVRDYIEHLEEDFCPVNETVTKEIIAC